jgi:hypothetical protein
LPRVEHKPGELEVYRVAIDERAGQAGDRAAVGAVPDRERQAVPGDEGVVISSSKDRTATWTPEWGSPLSRQGRLAVTAFDGELLRRTRVENESGRRIGKDIKRGRACTLPHSAAGGQMTVAMGLTANAESR